MNTVKGSRSKAPIQVRRGTVTVTIYRGSNRVQTPSGLKEYSQFTLIYRAGNHRVRRRFASLEEAQREANLAADKLANAEHEALKLTPTDRLRYVSACELLQPLGISLEDALRDYLRAVRLLPSGSTLCQAAESFARRCPSINAARPVPELVAEMLAAKGQAGRGERHLDDLRCRLNRFAAMFPRQLSEVTGASVQSYLDGIEGSPRSRVNHFGAIRNLFSFCVRRRYAAAEQLTDLDGVEVADPRGGEIEVFTAAEMARLLNAARAELVPFLAIGGFAGLRHAELQRLDWREVHLRERFIEVTA